MARAIYTQTIIAMIWDFDCTLIPRYSQTPIFDAFEIDETEFWAEVNNLREMYAARDLRLSADTAYLIHLLSYVRAGTMAGLTNTRLRELGAALSMCPGIPGFLTEIQAVVAGDDRYSKHEISIEHYIVSTGIKQLIAGSSVGPLVTGIWANEFVDQLPSPGYLVDGHDFTEEDAEIAQIGYMIDNTSKTRAIFEINKGPDFDVNARVAEEDRRVPIRNMIYIADGPSDVPVFSVVLKNGGRCLGVYQTGEKSNFDGVKQLEDEGRVNSIAPADYSEGTQARLWLAATVDEIATRICDDREKYLQEFKKPAGHNP